MKKSFSSIILIEDPLDWVYKLEDIGFDGWEIVSEGKQKFDINRVKDIYESTDLDFSIHLPFSDLNIASVNYLIWEETVRQMKECIEICAAFVEIAVVHPGHLSPLGAQMPDMAWKQMIEALRILCDFSAGYNITIALENMVNMDWLFGRYPHELLGIIETVNRDNICVAFDVGHANTTGTIEEFLHLEGIKHVHVHDNFGKKDDHLPLGSGNIDWEHVIGSLEPERMVIEVRSLEEGERSLNFLNLL